jgi:hypothetical protein
MAGYFYITPKVKEKKSPIDLKGIFAKNFIKKGEVVSIFGGRIISEEDYTRFLKNNKKYFRNYPIKITESFYIINSKNELNKADYFNHSCDPNCGIKGQILMVAMRDIFPGEELTYDYSMTDGDQDDYLECKCGQKNCRKIIKGTDWKNFYLQKKYKGFFAFHIQEKIDRQGKIKIKEF